MENYKAAFGGEGGCWARLVPKAAIGGVSPTVVSMGMRVLD
jgi:hypothetical protein